MATIPSARTMTLPAAVTVAVAAKVGFAALTFAATDCAFGAVAGALLAAVVAARRGCAG